MELKTKNTNNSEYITRANTAEGLRRKMAAALTDDEFVEWIDGDGRNMVGVVKLSQQEMELFKGGINWGMSIGTFGIGCGYSAAMGTCSWGPWNYDVRNA